MMALMNLSNLKISKKLVLAFASVILSFTGVAAIIFVNLSNIRSASEQNDHAGHVLSIVKQLTEIMLDYSGQIRGYLLTRDEAYADGVAADKKNLDQLLGRLRDAVAAPEQKARLGTIAQTIGDYNAKAGDPEMRFGGNPATLDQALAVIRSGANKIGMNAFKAAAKEFSEKETELLNERAASRDAAIHSAQLSLFIGALIALSIASFMGWLLSHQIANPVVAMTAVMKRLASGDHNIEVPATGRADEVGQMAAAVLTFKEAAIEKLRLEQESEATRAQAEMERQHSEAIRAKAAEEQTSAMERLAAGLKRLAGGDLTSRLDDGFSASYVQIKNDFNEAAAKLMETVRAVVTSTNAINSGTREISTASDDLSHRTEQQAARLEETAAALDEITATVKKSAEGAKHACEVVASADADAQSGAAVVKQAVEAMEGISKSSQQISQIIGVIDEIAFQTNLLALNAGVAAARAGDAGRGFAVVASEVRALAQRSADAAKEIKGLISNSSTQVGSGVKLVSETGAVLERITGQVAEISRVVAAIAAAAQEQATGLQQVNTAINQMDQTTQQNATMVEESTVASHSLSQETTQLATLADQFQVGGSISPANIRRELQKVAPHAFQKAPRADAAKAALRASQAGVKATSHIQRPRLKAANGGPEPTSSGDGWNEF